jgi:hypothetical protein
MILRVSYVFTFQDYQDCFLGTEGSYIFRSLKYDLAVTWRDATDIIY